MLDLLCATLDLEPLFLVINDIFKYNNLLFLSLRINKLIKKLIKKLINGHSKVFERMWRRRTISKNFLINF